VDVPRNAIHAKGKLRVGTGPVGTEITGRHSFLLRKRVILFIIISNLSTISAEPCVVPKHSPSGSLAGRTQVGLHPATEHAYPRAATHAAAVRISGEGLLDGRFGHEPAKRDAPFR